MNLSRDQQQLATKTLIQLARQESNHAEKWLLLSAAHVAGQTVLALHISTHLAMLSLAWREKRWAESWGQLMRLILVPLGHALGTLPLGNPGTANVSAFKALPVAHELQMKIQNALKHSL
jgi:Protein of unknown function (DUF3703)